MFTNVGQVIALLKEVDQEIQRRLPIKQNVKVLRSLAVLRFIRNRLDRIVTLLMIEKYNLVFIGQVGVGKTTTICHLLNLTHQVERRNRKITEELLSTGSGKTTICEVIIKSNPTTSIEIQPYSIEEIKQFLEEFCHFIWHKAYPEENTVIDVPPAELVRAIRNMIALNELHSRDSEGRTISTDTALELANSFTPRQYEDFKLAVTSRANLDSRHEKRLEYTPSSDSTTEEEKLWIKQSFRSLNLVKLPNFSIPKKIQLNIRHEITDLSQFRYFSSVVDTRGMDVVRDRKDLEAYIRNDDQALCIFTDAFPSAPTSVADLIGRYLTQESKDIDTKLALLVLPRKGEPEAMVGPDGSVDDREEGIARRRSDIEASLQGQKIKFINGNILFYDPLFCYLPDGRLDPDMTQEDIDVERQALFTQIEEIILGRKNQLLLEASRLASVFHQVLRGDDLDEESERLIADLKKTIMHCGRLTQTNRSVLSRLIKLLRSYHVMIFRAINNRFGTYDMRDIDIYFESKGIAESLCRENLDTLKASIDGAFFLVKKHAAEMSGLQPIMDILQEQVNQYYEIITITIGDNISHDLKDQRLAPQNYTNEFWESAQLRWGKGPGYRDDVLDMYRENIDDLDTFFEKEIKRLWEEEFMQKILEFFGDGDESL